MEILEFIPLPSQKTFLYALLEDKTVKYPWYVGGFGSGKTTVGSVGAINLSLMVPRNRGLISRFTSVDLKRTTLKTLFETLEKYYGMTDGNGYIYDRTLGEIKFDNGSEIILTGLDDYGKLKSMELGWAWIDEVDEVSEEVYAILQGRLRLPLSKEYDHLRKLFITSNSEGRNWTWRKIVKKETVTGKQMEDKEKYFWVQAPSTQNTHLPKDYVDLLKTYEGDRYVRYVEGGFNVFEGQIFPSFKDSVHVYDSIKKHPSWSRIYGFDYGGTNPTVLLYAYIDFDGNIFIDDEYYVGMVSSIDVHARGMLEKTGGDQILAIADPSCLSLKRGRANPENPYDLLSIGDSYEELGISLIPGNNDVHAGIEEIRRYLAFDPERMNPITKKKGAPRMFVNKRCVNTIREFKSYRWKKQSPTAAAKGLNMSEEPEKRDDHAMDALRYLIMSYPSAPSFEESYGNSIEDIIKRDIKETWENIDKGSGSVELYRERIR